MSSNIKCIKYVAKFRSTEVTFMTSNNTTFPKIIIYKKIYSKMQVTRKLKLIKHLSN